MLPKKIVSRKEEITADFLRIYHDHLEALFAGRERKRMHTSDYAARLFIHPRHLTNTLLLTTGKSPCAFMEEAITTEACRLLDETTLTVAEIAWRFGYDEPTNFVKFFKGMTGTTPLRYRKSRAV